jgi:hypothetical protein
MSSMSGFVTYINYTAGTNKGDVAQGDLFNNPFMLGEVKPNYTSAVVTATPATGTGFQALPWSPIVKGAFEVVDLDPAGSHQWIETKFLGGRVLTDAQKATITAKDVKVVNGSTVTYLYAVEGTESNAGTYKFYTDAAGSSQYTVVAGDTAAYMYDNVVIPQNDLPILNAKMESIPLLAKARRIAVYYSQIAAFQAKTDYGFDLGDQLAEKAVGQLSYEIDTEVVNLLAETAGAPQAALTWSKTLPVGVSKTEHYAGFSEILEIGRQIIYDRTRRFAPNYMIIASDVLPVLTFIPGFTAAPAGQVNGPYFAGTLNALRVYVSPAMDPGKFCIGCNGDDMMSSVAVYAPYMAIVPTQLLQYADGGTSQGWSTLYDLKVLNANLIVKGEITA